jgi:hypothetical protein
MKRLAQPHKEMSGKPANVALFNLRDRHNFLNDSVLKILKPPKAFVISDDAGFLPAVPKYLRLDFAAVGLDRVLIEPSDVFANLQLKTASQTSGIVVDMRWAMRPNAFPLKFVDPSSQFMIKTL